MPFGPTNEADIRRAGEVDQRFDQFDAATFAMVSHDLQRDPSMDLQTHAMEDMARRDYWDQALPGGMLHSMFEDEISRAQAKVDDIDRLIADASTNPQALRSAARDLGLDAATDEGLLKAATRKRSSMQSITTGISNRLRELRHQAEEFKRGGSIVAKDAAAHTGAAKMKTEGKQEQRDRLHEGVSIDEMIADRAKWTMTVDSDDAVGEIKRFVGAPDWVGDDPDKLRGLLNELVDQAIDGQDAKYWYEYSSSLINRMARGNMVVADKLAQLLAIYSSNTNLDDNFQAMKRAWDQYSEAVRQGRYIPIRAGALGRQDRQAESVLYGGTDWSGRKTNNFYTNLMSLLNPSLRQGVTVDVWAKRPFKYDLDRNGNEKPTGNQPTDAQYAFIENMYRQAASELSAKTGQKWTPMQVQAAIWTHARSMDERGSSDVAERNAAAAKRKHEKLGKDAPRFAALLAPGELEKRLSGATNRFYDQLKTISAKVDQLAATGEISDEARQKARDVISQSAAGYNPDRDPAKPGEAVEIDLNNLASEVTHIRRAYEDSIEHTLSEHERAVSWENAKATEEGESGRVWRNAVDAARPAKYDFTASASRVAGGQFNMELIPHPDSGFGLDDIAHAPFEVREAFGRELYPLVQEVLAHAGVLRGPAGDLRGFDDRAETNPLYAIGTLLPRAVGGGTVDPTRRTDSTSPAIEGASERQAKLAAALLAYIFKQESVAYMNMKPLVGYKGAMQGLKTPEAAREYGAKVPASGDDANVFYEGDQTDKANLAYYKFTSGAMPLDAWRDIVDRRNEIAAKYGVDPSAMPVVPTADGEGFAIINLTTEDGHEGKQYSNREFQKISDEIVTAVDDVDERWDVAKRLFANGGDIVRDTWKGETPGENHRNRIRELGGDKALAFADRFFEEKVRPLYSKWEGWRKGHREVGVDESRTFPEKLLASERATGAHEHPGAGRGSEYARRVRLGELKLSERDSLVAMARRLKARRVLLGESEFAPVRPDDSATIALARALIGHRM